MLPIVRLPAPIVSVPEPRPELPVDDADVLVVPVELRPGMPVLKVDPFSPGMLVVDVEEVPRPGMPVLNVDPLRPGMLVVDVEEVPIPGIPVLNVDPLSPGMLVPNVDDVPRPGIPVLNVVPSPNPCAERRRGAKAGNARVEGRPVEPGDR